MDTNEGNAASTDKKMETSEPVKAGNTDEHLSNEKEDVNSKESEKNIKLTKLKSKQVKLYPKEVLRF